MYLRRVLFLIPLLFATALKAQTSIQLNAGEIKLALNKLKIAGSALYIAAHPDDENTRLLTYLARERKVRTGYLSLTRGDGGQNLIGTEQAELLGVIRTQELLEARKIDGAEQFFSRAIDFGFSKTAEEALKIWNKEKILSDAVWVIRKFRPDVIITRFPEDERAGHGQHAASSILAHEAFKAASDPRKFPEQLKYVQPWQAKRILWNTYNFGGNNTTSEDQLKIDVGGFNFLLGKGYGEIAAESRSEHKSQGFGSGKSRGQQFDFFSHTAGDKAEKDLFDNIDLSWNRIKGGTKISAMIEDTERSFDMEDPSKSVAKLVKILDEVEKLEDSYWKEQKSKEIKALIISCAGLWFESYADKPSFAVSDKIQLKHPIVLRSNIQASLKQIKTGKTASPVNKALGYNQPVDFTTTTEAQYITQPYWLAEKSTPGLFTVANQQLIGNPENPNSISSEFTFDINGKNITFDRPLVYKFTDPVRGEVYQPIAVAPPVTATIAEKAIVFVGSEPKQISVSLKSFRAKVKGRLTTKVPTGWKVSPQVQDISFEKDGEEQNLTLTVTPNHVKQGTLSLSIQIDGQVYQKGLTVIRYDHIPVQTLFPESEAQLNKVDIKTNGKNIGYLTGAGDLVAESLKQIGYNVTVLSENTILNTDLSRFDAIVVGVRAYNVNERMRFIQPRLLEYVKSGGNVLVQYNTNGRLQTSDIGPYPFTISRNRVTDETAKVTFLDPQHPILNYPNKITLQDFDHWVQERGLYFLSDPDKHYTPILSMADPGESANNGSLLVTEYGKGKFVYTSLSFFRQLPAGVPGAYRLFVNLIAKNKKDGQ